MSVVSNVHSAQGYYKGKILYICGSWSAGIFVLASDCEISCPLWVVWLPIQSTVAMMLRVWALFSQSRPVLWTLSIFYVLEMITFIISCVLPEARNNPQSMWIIHIRHMTMYSPSFHSHAVVATQVLDLSFCNAQFIFSTGPLIADVFQIAFSVLLCLLVAIRFIKELLETRGAKRIRLNRYIKALTREGIFYFLVYVYTSFCIPLS